MVLGGSEWRSAVYKSEQLITASGMHRFTAKLSVTLYRFAAVKCVFRVILSEAKNLIFNLASREWIIRDVSLRST